VSTKDSDYTQFLGLVRARRCSTGKSRRGIALVASEQVSLAHGAPIAARGSPRLSRSTHCGSILAHIESAGARPRVAATTRCCGGRCFGGIAREHCGSVGNCNGGLLLSGPDCGPGGFGGPAVGANDAVAFSQRRIDWSGKRVMH